jgi:hypothetical protein
LLKDVPPNRLDSNDQNNILSLLQQSGCGEAAGLSQI